MVLYSKNHRSIYSSIVKFGVDIGLWTQNVQQLSYTIQNLIVLIFLLYWQDSLLTFLDWWETYTDIQFNKVSLYSCYYQNAGVIEQIVEFHDTAKLPYLPPKQGEPLLIGLCVCKYAPSDV